MSDLWSVFRISAYQYPDWFPYDLQLDVLQGPAIEGLTEDFFTPPIKLHVTINVMTLLDDHDIARAKQLLEECVEEVIV